jgi:hypothetical protein
MKINDHLFHSAHKIITFTAQRPRLAMSRQSVAYQVPMAGIARASVMVSTRFTLLRSGDDDDDDDTTK